MTALPEHFDHLSAWMRRDLAWTPTWSNFDVAGATSLWDPTLFEAGPRIESSRLPVTVAGMSATITAGWPIGMELLSVTTADQTWLPSSPVSAFSAISAMRGLEAPNTFEEEEQPPPQASPQAVSTAWLDGIHSVTSVESSDLASWYASMDED